MKIWNLKENHGFSIGQKVCLSGFGAGVNGVYIVDSIGKNKDPASVLLIGEGTFEIVLFPVDDEKERQEC